MDTQPVLPKLLSAIGATTVPCCWVMGSWKWLVSIKQTTILTSGLNWLEQGLTTYSPWGGSGLQRNLIQPAKKCNPAWGEKIGLTQLHRIIPQLCRAPLPCRPAALQPLRLPLLQRGQESNTQRWERDRLPAHNDSQLISSSLCWQKAAESWTTAADIQIIHQCNALVYCDLWFSQKQIYSKLQAFTLVQGCIIKGPVHIYTGIKADRTYVNVMWHHPQMQYVSKSMLDNSLTIIKDGIETPPPSISQSNLWSGQRMGSLKWIVVGYLAYILFAKGQILIHVHYLAVPESHSSKPPWLNLQSPNMYRYSQREGDKWDVSNFPITPQHSSHPFHKYPVHLLGHVGRGERAGLLICQSPTVQLRSTAFRKPRISFLLAERHEGTAELQDEDPSQPPTLLTLETG